MSPPPHPLFRRRAFPFSLSFYFFLSTWKSPFPAFCVHAVPGKEGVYADETSSRPRVNHALTIVICASKLSTCLYSTVRYIYIYIYILGCLLLDAMRLRLSVLYFGFFSFSFGIKTIAFITLEMYLEVFVSLKGIYSELG